MFETITGLESDLAYRTRGAGAPRARGDALVPPDSAIVLVLMVTLMMIVLMCSSS
jgi:hypothetical protein